MSRVKCDSFPLGRQPADHAPVSLKTFLLLIGVTTKPNYVVWGYAAVGSDLKSRFRNSLQGLPRRPTVCINSRNERTTSFGTVKILWMQEQLSPRNIIFTLETS
jgi:hypothetical protein